MREKSQSQKTSSCQALLDSDHEQLMGADTLLQGPHFQGQSSASRAVAAGSLHIYRCTGNMGSPQPPKWAKPGVSLRGCVCSVRGGGSGEHSGRQSAPPPPHTRLAPCGNSHSPSPLPAACAHPCSSSPRCWERSSGSTEYKSSCFNFRS